MHFLLDTHTFIMFTGQPERLPQAVRAALADVGNTLVLSVVSPWEMQIKADLGKLRLGKSVRELVQFEIDRGAITSLPIKLEHIAALALLPPLHRIRSTGC